MCDQSPTATFPKLPAGEGSLEKGSLCLGPFWGSFFCSKLILPGFPLWKSNAPLLLQWHVWALAGEGSFSGLSGLKMLQAKKSLCSLLLLCSKLLVLLWHLRTVFPPWTSRQYLYTAYYTYKCCLRSHLSLSGIDQTLVFKLCPKTNHMHNSSCIAGLYCSRPHIAGVLSGL